ncbi:MAG: peptide-methionine (S)-S-oxide reductase MsrA [Campylobacterales bacterium]
MTRILILILTIGGILMGGVKKSELVVGGGCFWCLEAVFEKLDGVDEVINGYAGGSSKNPTYKEVSDGVGGHAEVVKIVYDPLSITLEELLDVFFSMHDPTTLNAQGNDVGIQYRSIILYKEEQKNTVDEAIKKAKTRFDKPITTEVVPLERFYEAEEYHQDYFRKNPSQPYCTFVISPKVKKLEKAYKEMISK